MLRNTSESWGSVAKSFHWLIAILILIMIVLGWTGVLLPKTPLRVEVFQWHKSTGLLILALMTGRLLWRLVNPVPVLPPTLKGWEKTVAAATHWLIYAAVFVMPLSGYTLVSAANSPFRFYKTFTVPLLVPPNRPLAHTAGNIHYWTFWILAVLLLLHIAAALRHHFVLKDNILTRMLPGSAPPAEVKEKAS
jgi:cytochrome b561